MDTMDSIWNDHGMVMAVLRHAPLIPAGMESFHRNPLEWHWNPQEWHWNPQEWTGMAQEWTGMAQEWTKMDILEPMA
jgi:hypothetical protein